MITFKQLGLSDSLLAILDELEFKTPTDIQAQAIPLLLSRNTDIIGLAQTGTGKTAAFALPIIQKLDLALETPQVLILAPTRELGRQIAEQLKIFSRNRNDISVTAVYGGAPIFNQIKSLKKTQHIVIATPGRLLDLINRKAINLSECHTVVLDEADEMLNMGFKEDIDAILESISNEHYSTWLFSATMPKAIRKIVKKYMTDPEVVEVSSGNEVNTNITHYYASVRSRDKSEALKRFFDLSPEMRSVVFCRTRLDTQELAEELLALGYKADALHGDLSQAQREKVMARFRENKISALIATDVAARGIDVNDLTHVFHFALPDELDYYTHRSGRTGRAGKKGKSIAFVNQKQMFRIKRIQNALSIHFEKISIPLAEDVAQARVELWCRDIMKKRTKNKIPEDLLQKALLLFGNLSKEELIAKVLKAELDSLNFDNNDDINDYSTIDRKSDKRGDKSRGRGRNRGRGSRSRRDRNSRPFNRRKKGQRSAKRKKNKS